MRCLPLVSCALALALTGCAVPKVLYSHSYAASDKSIETFIQRSGASVGSGENKTNLFNLYMRVCDQGADNATSNCKDTLLLENVDRKSL
jgi:hypothetical protein